MEQDLKLRRRQGKRLQAVRLAAGFRSARAAAAECEWPESTYRSHENGSRRIGQDDAERYMNRFKAYGAKGYSARWLLFGEERSLDKLLETAPPEVAQRAYEAALAEIERKE